MKLDNPFWGPDWPKIRGFWSLDPKVAHLNHGSFGAVPIPVQEYQNELRRKVEANPMKALSRDLHSQLDEARKIAADFLKADLDGFVFVPNATTGTNTVLASPIIQPGDKVLITDQAYGAVRYNVERICLERKARAVVVKIPVPEHGSRELFEPILAAVTKNTRLAIIDHVASSTALVFPIEKLIRELHKHNVLVLIDGAHAPGMFNLDLNSLSPDFWTGNFHKWCNAPRGAAGLWVSEEHRKEVRPIITSWYDKEGYPSSFRWLGTNDYTSYLSVPAAIDFMGKLGWEKIRSHNRKLARYGRDVVGKVRGMTPIKPDEDNLFESMTLVQLPKGAAETEEEARILQARFGEELGVEAVPIPWNGHGYLRLSAQAYNAPSEYDRFAEGLERLLIV